MFSTLLIAILLILAVCGLWYPLAVSVILLGLYFLIEVSGIAPTLTKHQANNELGLTDEEKEVFSKYYTFFRYRIGAQDISRMFAAIQVSSFVFVPLFFFKGLPIPAIVLVVNYFLVGPFAVKLNPVHYLGEELKKGRVQFAEEYEQIASVSEKIAAYQDRKRSSI